MDMTTTNAPVRRISIPSVTNVVIGGSARQELVHYKAMSFHSGRKNASVSLTNTFVIETKGIKPDWDPNVGVNGGWRCPVGTRYGGYITDRFGRGCGGGIIRRVGRLFGELGDTEGILPNLGERLSATGMTRDLRRLRRAAARDRRLRDTVEPQRPFDGMPIRAGRRLGRSVRREISDGIALGVGTFVSFPS